MQENIFAMDGDMFGAIGAMGINGVNPGTESNFYSVYLIFLVGLVVIAIISTFCRLCQLKMGWPQRLWWGANYLIVRWLWRATSVGAPLPLEPGKGAVVTCNHSCRFEPMLIETVTNRVVHWMTAMEYFKGVAGFFLGLAQTIPTSRGGVDTRATKIAMRHLQNGDALGIFPEGRINIDKESLLLPGKLGAAMMALIARVPVIPCYIHGLPYEEKIFALFVRPARIEMVFGKPIDFSEFYGREADREVLGIVTKRIMKEIATLAGHPEFEPQVSGRAPRANSRLMRQRTQTETAETTESAKSLRSTESTSHTTETPAPSDTTKSN